jgi:hypothetical protein
VIAPRVSPTLADASRRYAEARARVRALVQGIDEATFHRAPEPGSWSIAECLEHLVVSGTKTTARLEVAVAEARAAGRTASPEAARAPVKLGWFARLFLAGTGPTKGGVRPRMRVSVREPFDPGDPRGRGRDRDVVLADFLELQDRLDRAAAAADGLDLSGVMMASVLAQWMRSPIGAWFLAIAGHQERHLDQALRARVALESTMEVPA